MSLWYKCCQFLTFTVLRSFVFGFVSINFWQAIMQRFTFFKKIPINTIHSFSIIIALPAKVTWDQRDSLCKKNEVNYPPRFVVTSNILCGNGDQLISKITSTWYLQVICQTLLSMLTFSSSTYQFSSKTIMGKFQWSGTHHLGGTKIHSMETMLCI